jgi:hypothetical protein
MLCRNDRSALPTVFALSVQLKHALSILNTSVCYTISLTVMMCSELYVYDVVSDVWSCPAWQGTEGPNGRFAHSSCILPATAATTATAVEATVPADAVTDSSSSSSTSGSSSCNKAAAAVQQQTVAVFGGVCPEEQGESPSVTLLCCNGTAAR